MADRTRVTSFMGDSSPKSVHTVRANLLNRRLFSRRRTPSIPRARRQRQRRERQAGALRRRRAGAAWHETPLPPWLVADVSYGWLHVVGGVIAAARVGGGSGCGVSGGRPLPPEAPSRGGIRSGGLLLEFLPPRTRGELLHRLGSHSGPALALAKRGDPLVLARNS